MKVGEQVFLKFHPELRGTISQIRPDGRFLVTWLTQGRRPGQPRSRFWYSRDALKTGMQVGIPS